MDDENENRDKKVVPRNHCDAIYWKLHTIEVLPYT